jgi:hypothetical protein
MRKTGDTSSNKKSPCIEQNKEGSLYGRQLLVPKVLGSGNPTISHGYQPRWTFEICSQEELMEKQFF